MPKGKRILHLVLKEEWFYGILKHGKLEEYRDLTDYWRTRLCDKHDGAIGGDFMDDHKVIAYTFKHFDIVRFRHGYTRNAPTMDVEWKGTNKGEGHHDWGAAPGKNYFVISLGKIIAKKNC